MVGVRLDPRGKLRWFRAVPPNTRVKATDAPIREPEWSEWFTERHLGFTLDDLSPSDWRPTPPNSSDCIQAWEGSWPNSDEPLRVEAAACRGRPVYFSVLPPRRRKAAAQVSEFRLDTKPLAEAIFFPTLYATLVAAFGFGGAESATWTRRPTRGNKDRGVLPSRWDGYLGSAWHTTSPESPDLRIARWAPPRPVLPQQWSGSIT